jgi:mercuric ion binding protein
MDCPVCPITLKKALSQVPSVSQADVNFGKRQAVVTFDDAKTNVAALTESTKNAGYPSTLVGTLMATSNSPTYGHPNSSGGKP